MTDEQRLSEIKALAAKFPDEGYRTEVEIHLLWLVERLEEANAEAARLREYATVADRHKSHWKTEHDKAFAEVTRLRSAQFEPSGDNHHNAAMCPHCGEQLRKALEENARLKAEIGGRCHES